MPDAHLDPINVWNGSTYAWAFVLGASCHPEFPFSEYFVQEPQHIRTPENQFENGVVKNGAHDIAKRFFQLDWQA